MTGQIPPYGENFKHARVGEYHPALSDTIYVLKQDNEWFIRSDKPSKRWFVCHGYDRNKATTISRSMPNMKSAMKLMLDGIGEGFYVVTDDDGTHAPDCGLQGSGLHKSCTCHVGWRKLNDAATA